MYMSVSWMMLILTALIVSPYSSAQTQGGYCLFCQFSKTIANFDPGKADMCEDLYGAVCLDEKGEPKHKGTLRGFNKILNSDVDRARDATAKAMGFESFDAALKEKFKSAGLELAEPIDEKAFAELKRGNQERLRDSPAGKLFAGPNQCHKRVSEIMAKAEKEKKQKNLKAALAELAKIKSQYTPELVKLYAKDIPLFIAEHLGPGCESVADSPEPEKKGKKGKQRQTYNLAACARLAQIRRQAIDLFRQEGTKDYQAKAEAFVRENMLPVDVISDLDEPLPPTMVAGIGISRPRRGDKNSQLRMQIEEAAELAEKTCGQYSSVAAMVGDKIYSDFAGQVSKAKPTVDALIDSFYSEQNKANAELIFRETRAEIQSIVDQFVKDPKKNSRIQNGYKELKFNWPEKPPESYYTNNDQGIPSLDSKKFPPMAGFQADLLSALHDPKLSFFKTLNANYTPSRVIGSAKAPESVTMMPAFVRAMEQNPLIFTEVLAHETGHKIGPEISRMNGYDLTAEWKQLLDCYKERNSIRMQPDQEDEVIADYISSEVIARQLARLPENQRRAALMASMEGYCVLDSENYETHTVNCKGEHPEDSLRVAGIFGANPNIREVIGCKTESSKFKSCGLGIPLEISGPNKSSDPVPTSRGVK